MKMGKLLWYLVQTGLNHALDGARSLWPSTRIMALATVLASLSLQAQEPEPEPEPEGPTPAAFQLQIDPPEQFVLVEDTDNPIYLSIRNFEIYTNITVVGEFNGTTDISFLDDGNVPDDFATNGVFSGLITTPPLVDAVEMELTLVISGYDTNFVLDANTGELDITNAFLSVTNVYKYIVVPRPVNDDFANSIKIPNAGGIIHATNNYASIETNEPPHAMNTNSAASVWWTWSSPVTGNVLIDLAGSSFNPVLAIYRGNSLETLSPVAFSTNDTVNGLQANVNFNATLGSTYRIAVSGYDDSTSGVGNIMLRIVPGGYPDTNAPLTTITAPLDGSLFDNNLVLFTGEAKDNQTNDIGVREVYLQVNGDEPQLAIGTNSWQLELDLPPGTNTVSAYAIDYAGNVGPAVSITVTFMNPTNDYFRDSIELPEVAGFVTAINGRATKESSEPNHAVNDGGRSIWYHWRAPLNGIVTLTTEGSSFDTLLAVYTGDSVTNLVLIAENDDVELDSGFSALNFIAVSNQVYRIAIDGYADDSGYVSLGYAFTTTEIFQRLTVNTPVGGGVTPLSGLYLKDSLQIVTATPQRDYEFIGWTGDVESTDNPLIVQLTEDITLTAHYRVKRFTDGFESQDFTGLPWNLGTGAAWSVTGSSLADGEFAARSGAITDGQNSRLALTITTLAGTGAFDFSVSSETGGWDRLEFYLNGVRLGRWSGELPWQNFQFPLTARVNHLLWVYAKDNNFSAGQDAAFIDNLYLPLDIPDETDPAARLAFITLSNGDCQLQLTGQANRNYTLESSSDLVTWTPVTTVSVTGGTAYIPIPAVDTAAPALYYRAVTN